MTCSLSDTNGESLHLPILLEKVQNKQPPEDGLRWCLKANNYDAKGQVEPLGATLGDSSTNPCPPHVVAMHGGWELWAQTPQDTSWRTGETMSNKGHRTDSKVVEAVARYKMLPTPLGIVISNQPYCLVLHCVRL